MNYKVTIPTKAEAIIQKFLKTNAGCGEALKMAVESCMSKEEEGGIILKRPTAPNYIFVKVPNELSGTPKAISLYLLEREAFARDVVGLTLRGQRWDIYASFHTHPSGVSAHPSLTDFKNLFTSFKVNFILSASSKELMRYTFNRSTDSTQYWTCENFYNALGLMLEKPTKPKKRTKNKNS